MLSLILDWGQIFSCYPVSQLRKGHKLSFHIFSQLAEKSLSNFFNRAATYQTNAATNKDGNP